MITLLVGPIASGKTTFCLAEAKKGEIIVNGDSIVESVHGGVYTEYDKSLKLLYKSIEHQILQTAIALGKNVTVDATHSTKSSRNRYLSLAKTLDTEVRCVTFKREDPEVHGRRRYESDSRGVSLEEWIKIAQYHESIFEPPTMDEGFIAILPHESKI